MKGKDKAKYKRIRASQMVLAGRIADAVHRIAMAFKPNSVAWKNLQKAMKRVQNTSQAMLKKMEEKANE